jgi:RimJ/RimL family protein N-acetyltransferase
VVADTFEDHVASRRVMEKAGMTLFDARTETVDGEEARLVFYEIRRPSNT